MIAGSIVINGQLASDDLVGSEWMMVTFDTDGELVAEQPLVPNTFDIDT